MKKKILLALFGFLVLVILALTAVILLRNGFSGLGAGSETVVNISNLQEQILSIGELATIEYDYTNVIDSQNSLTIKGWNVPGTKKSFIVSLDGTMKIGIDAAGAVIASAEGSQDIVITIPKAKILSHEIHEDAIRVLDQKSGMFNPVKIEDYTGMAAEEKKAMEKKLVKGDLFARAETEAARMIQTLIEALVPPEYTVQVVVAKAAPKG